MIHSTARAICVSVLCVYMVVGFLAQVSLTLAQETPDSTEPTVSQLPESLRAAQLIATRLPDETSANETIVVRSEHLTVDDPQFSELVSTIADDLRAMPGIVDTVTVYYEAAAAGNPEAKSYVSPDRHVMLMPVTLAGTASDLLSSAAAYLSLVSAHDSIDMRVLTIGSLSINHSTVAALNLGDPCGPDGDLAMLPSDELQEAYRIILSNFPVSEDSIAMGNIIVVIDGPMTDPSVQSGIEFLLVALSLDNRVGAPKLTQVDTSSIAVLDVPLAIDPCSLEAFDLVSRLRNIVVPTAFNESTATVSVGGWTAASLDASQ